MNSRERLLNIIDGKQADRRGWAPELNSFFVEKTLKERNIPFSSNMANYAACCNLIGADTLGGANVVEIKYNNVKTETERTGDEVIYKFETDRGVVAYIEKECKCFKPNTGMIEEALTKKKLDKKNTHIYVIGDRENDILTALNAKGVGILVPFEKNLEELEKVKDLKSL